MSAITTKGGTRKLLGIAGSLRGDSYSKAVLRSLAEKSWEGVEIEILDISSIPLYNADQDFEPDVVLDELTDLPDDAAQISELAGLNARIRTEGTQNLIEAARRSGSPKILAQSVAWQLPAGPDAQAVAELERAVLAERGVVLRYGQFYGPGTYNDQPPPEAPRVQIDRAAERTVEALAEPTGVVVIVD